MTPTAGEVTARDNIGRWLPVGHTPRKMADSFAWRIRIAYVKRLGRRRVALASYPRSGNTWLRFLLEAATGEETGTAGRNPSLMLKRSHSGIVIKTHSLDSHKYTHGIHLVRNPFDVLDSFYDWKQSLGWTWKYGALSWDDFVTTFAVKWQKHARHWATSPCEIYTIRYEDCRRDPFGSFSSLLSWMGKDISDETLKEAIEATSFEQLKRLKSAESSFAAQFFRRGQVNRGIERFSRQQQEWMVTLLEPELIQYGYAAVVESVRSRR